MRPCTRRHALHGAAALLAGFAGCTGSSSSSSTVTVGEGGRGYPDDADTSPEHYALRGTDETLLVRPPEREASGGSDETSEDEWHWQHRLVASADAADSLSFADVDGVDGAKQFLAETDFDHETVYLEQRRIAACYELELCYIRWEPDHVETQYGRELRPADVACEVDDQHVVATFVRIPAQPDPDNVNRYSSGASGGGCRPPAERRVETTAAPTTESETTDTAEPTETAETTDTAETTTAATTEDY